MKWDWILFDADETLFSFDDFSGLQRMFLDYRVTFTAKDYQHYQAINQLLWVEYQNGTVSALALQHRRFQEWAECLRVTPEALNTAFLNTMADICAPLPGAQSLLNMLKGQVKLGIITNGFTVLQQNRLARSGFPDYFDLLVISEELGAAKPSPVIFDCALEKMGNPPRDRVLMVGDTVESDILGGINARLSTCWLNANGRELPLGIV